MAADSRPRRYARRHLRSLPGPKAGRISDRLTKIQSKRGQVMRVRILRATVTALASLSIAVGAGSAARATGAQVTRGTLHPFAAAITDPVLAAEYGDLS